MYKRDGSKTGHNQRSAAGRSVTGLEVELPEKSVIETAEERRETRPGRFGRWSQACGVSASPTDRSRTVCWRSRSAALTSSFGGSGTSCGHELSAATEATHRTEEARPRLPLMRDRFEPAHGRGISRAVRLDARRDRPTVRRAHRPS